MLEQIIEEVLLPEETNEIVEEDEYQHFESNQVKVSPKSISIPSVSTVNNSSGLENSTIPDSQIWSLKNEIKKLDEVSRSNNSTELPSLQINEKLDKNVTEKDYGSKEVAPATTASYFTDQQSPHGQTQSTIKMSQVTGLGSYAKKHFGDDISLVSGVTIHKSSSANILIQDSHVIKQDNEMNEDKTEIAPYKNIKIQEEVNLLDKTEGVGIVSNNDVVVTPDTRTRLEKYKQFVDLNDSQISLLVEAIEAYPHLWNASFMLKTLTDMLLFLRSERVGSINSEREKEFFNMQGHKWVNFLVDMII
ncbi:hypothetical protein V8G54_036711 [Vigna mungo]|uniref:Uncharacterized protein n=1 Tax=Vigna mungo TaxID=3915 RepID=A0AAQ3RFV9_VIGMU